MKVINAGAHGDIKNCTLTIDGENVTQFMNVINIYQDIFTPCWSAVVSIEDSANILMQLPIKPGSELSFTVETDVKSIFDGQKTYNFIIYKIDDRIQKGQMHVSYNLYCASRGFLTNQTRRIQKTYSKMKPEEAVSNLCSEFLGGSVTNSDPSDVNYHVIIPNWSPFIAGWWFAKLALLENRSDYIFFMKDFDEYWFKSLEVLYTTEDTGITFKQKPSNFRDDAGNFDSDYCVMIMKYFIFHYDGMGNLGTGYYRSKLLSYNMISKKWEQKVFTYGDDIAVDKEMKPWEIYDEAENANISFLPLHPGHHENPTMDDQVQNWHVSRKSRLMKLEQDKLQIQIQGGAKTWELLGRSCKVELPSNQDQSEDDVFDKHFQGDYLISHINHYVTQSKYVNNFELIKIRHDEKM